MPRYPVNTAVFTANKASTVVDVPDTATSMAVAVPVLDAGNLSIQGLIAPGGTFYTMRGKSGDDDTAYTFTATTGSFVLSCVIVAGVRQIKFINSADVTGTLNVTFK